jgi:hypothetical protein
VLVVSSVPKSARTVNCDGPHRTVVPVKGAEALAVRRVPHVDDLVLGRREEQVALGVEDDLGERTLVSCELALRGRQISRKRAENEP